MRITLHPHPGFKKAAVCVAVRRRLLLALATFSDRIAHVAVEISDVDTPDGTIVGRCLLKLRTAQGLQFAAEEMEVDPTEAVTLAANRAARWLRRQLRIYDNLNPRFRAGDF